LPAAQPSATRKNENQTPKRIAKQDPVFKKWASGTAKAVPSLSLRVVGLFTVCGYGWWEVLVKRVGPDRSNKWKAIRLAVLARDGYRCQIRGPRCTGFAQHVDHIVPWRAGGAWFDMRNLRAACPTCNIGRKLRSSKELAMLRAGKLPPRAAKTPKPPPHVW
jgi:5-methylcytosine-specific restriction enzyme A